ASWLSCEGRAPLARRLVMGNLTSDPIGQQSPGKRFLFVSASVHLGDIAVELTCEITPPIQWNFPALSAAKLEDPGLLPRPGGPTSSVLLPNSPMLSPS